MIRLETWSKEPTGRAISPHTPTMHCLCGSIIPKSATPEMFFRLRLRRPIFSELEMVDTCIGKVVDTLNSKDESALLDLFSENALNEISENNYDGQIQLLFQYIDTTITAYEIYTPEPASSLEKEFGKISLELSGLYRLISTEKDYWMYYRFCPRNDFDSDEIGLMKISVTSDEIFQREDFFWLKASRLPPVSVIKTPTDYSE